MSQEGFQPVTPLVLPALMMLYGWQHWNRAKELIWTFDEDCISQNNPRIQQGVPSIRVSMPTCSKLFKRQLDSQNEVAVCYLS